MVGTTGVVLFFTLIVYIQCFVDVGGHNDTNSEVMNKIMVKKCCPKGQHLLRDTMKCREPKQWKNLSLPNIPLYRYVDNNIPLLSDKKFYDVYEIEISANRTFDPLTWYDFSKVNHQNFLSDVSMHLLILHVISHRIWHT